MRDPVFPFFRNNRILEGNSIAGRRFYRYRNHFVVFFMIFIQLIAQKCFILLFDIYIRIFAM